MNRFTSHQGQAVPLPRANVDTDVIVRMERCMEFSRDQLGPWAFESLRFAPGGVPIPTCVFNQPDFRNASILIAAENFGCGSSREMAVWALAGMGLRCIIAPSFGDIFHANCFQNGLLPIRLPADIVHELLAEAETGSLTLAVDLASQTISGSRRGTMSFDIEPLRKSMLLQGLDEISMSLAYEGRIAAWQEHDRGQRPWVYMPFRI